ncbi:phosphoribosylamine--glycine ligase [Novibacillus thermophilus]|uniref:Phosphoribosylamine--glycine ligase n=1 Tax=Novibacillus thermophilus TaxID=1471761 RepID=A0A1U9K3V3_9BACL|nr:phosphoribosylamine--glycine ligase [Novibacillus thermophilus]AQS54715.1 phosphoribosylamine--glycine ligase [Novibacillus thermophilus]
MRVLVVGGGGREHALCWKLKQSPRVEEIFCAPGNGGIADIATCVDIDADDFAALAQLVEKEGIGYTVVGPEQPLIDGIVDDFRDRGLAIFGPNRKAAQVEGSKSFAKDLMAKYDIPTAAYRTFSDFTSARKYVHEVGAPIVIKADGLAAGKGVTVAKTLEEAEAALERVMKNRVFGGAGGEVVIEECLSGEELSLMAFVSGRTVLPMVVAQDHKPAYDGDNGPNTGGMGAYSPVPQIGSDVVQQAVRDILQPMADAMAAEGLDYRGVLYAGLMVTAEGPKVIEFNARFGDPETQVVLPRLRSDLLEVLSATSEGRLDRVELEWEEQSALCVVLASGGYPGSYEKGFPISGLSPDIEADVKVFHAGTRTRRGQFVTDGGRVLGVTALGTDLVEAREKAYAAVDGIHFSGRHYRRDIGHKAIVMQHL